MRTPKPDRMITSILGGIFVAITVVLIWASVIAGGDIGPVTPTTTSALTPVTTTAQPPDVSDCSKSDGCCHHIHECETGNPIACAWVNTHHCCPDIDCDSDSDGAGPCPIPDGTNPTERAEGIPYCHDAGDCDSAETSCSWICCPDAPIAKLQGKKCCCPCVPDGNHSCAEREPPCPCTIVTPQCCDGVTVGDIDVTTDGLDHKINCAWCALGIVTNDAEEAWCLAHCKDDSTPH